MNIGKYLGGIVLGEIRGLFDRKRNNTGIFCQCGNRIGYGCEFWDSICNDIEKEFSMNTSDVAKLCRDIEYCTSDLKNHWFYPVYKEIWKSVFYKISSRIDNKRDLIFIDSSKTARGNRRVELLSDIYKERLYVVHLVRNPVQVINSRLKGKNTEKGLVDASSFAGYRGAIGWLVANHYVEKLKKSEKYTIVTVKYEDFVAEPIATLEHIVKPILNTNSGTEKAMFMHSVGGNRSRMKGVEINNDEKELTGFFAKTLAVIVNKFLNKYGY